MPALSQQLASILESFGRREFLVTEHPLGQAGSRIGLASYRAASWQPGGRIVLAFHEMNRDGAAMLKYWQAAAEQHDLLVLAPTFSAADFPGPESYNQGCVRAADGSAQPRERWLFRFPGWLCGQLELAGLAAPASQVFIFGHSAGGQFVHRLASTMPVDRFTGICAANPGWYSLPDLELEYPAGLGAIGLQTDELARLLSAPLVILAGAADIDPAAPDLANHETARNQGPHRFARAQHYFAAGQTAAAQLSIPFGWQLVPVPGVAHDAPAMSVTCAQTWFG